MSILYSTSKAWLHTYTVSSIRLLLFSIKMPAIPDKKPETNQDKLVIFAALPLVVRTTRQAYHQNDSTSTSRGDTEKQ